MNGKISNGMQVAYTRRYTLTEGKENGLKVIEVDNGCLRFILNESKALDIMQLWHEGKNISFVSKNGFTARELPFLRRFEGGMLYSCGLDSVGGREGFELHGNLHNTPAKVVECTCGEKEIVVRAEIEDTSLFGKNLLLLRTIKTEIGSDTLCVEDELINRGTKEEEYCLLYHINLGYPMLDEGVEIYSETEEVIPRTDWSAERIADRTVFTDCVDNEDERCYFIRNKVPCVQVTNRKLGKRFTLNYSADTLPCFVQWSSAASGDYALGVEPTTTFLDDRFEYKKLAVGNSVRFSIKMQIEKI